MALPKPGAPPLPHSPALPGPPPCTGSSWHKSGSVALPALGPVCPAWGHWRSDPPRHLPALGSSSETSLGQGDMQVGDRSKPQEQRGQEKSAGWTGLFRVTSSQVQPGPRRETAPRTPAQQAAGAAWGRRKLRGLAGSGGHTRAGQLGTGGAGACRLPSQFSPPLCSLRNDFPGLIPGPWVSASSCTICDSQQSLGTQLPALQHHGHGSWGWESHPGGP